jgi:hypothetical protein
MRLVTTAAVPLVEEDPTQMRKLDGEGETERRQQFGIPHAERIGKRQPACNRPSGPSFPLDVP